MGTKRTKGNSLLSVLRVNTGILCGRVRQSIEEHGLRSDRGYVNQILH